jgi:hypothetical protein
VASLPVYVDQLWERQKRIARRLGSDITQATKPERVLNRSLLVLLAAVIKTLTDKGIITDGDLIATLNTARDAGYDDEPAVPPLPEPDIP